MAEPWHPFVVIAENRLFSGTIQQVGPWGAQGCNRVAVEYSDILPREE